MLFDNLGVKRARLIGNVKGCMPRGVGLCVSEAYKKLNATPQFVGVGSFAAPISAPLFAGLPVMPH